MIFLLNLCRKLRPLRTLSDGNRLLTSLLLILLGTLVLPPPAESQIASAETYRGMRPVVIKDPETKLDITVYEKSWAVLIGINKYPGDAALNYATQDAAAMKNL